MACTCCSTARPNREGALALCSADALMNQPSTAAVRTKACNSDAEWI